MLHVVRLRAVFDEELVCDCQRPGGVDVETRGLFTDFFRRDKREENAQSGYDESSDSLSSVH